ncbi:hypothetical protein D3C71_1629880 [compost metagenome]
MSANSNVLMNRRSPSEIANLVLRARSWRTAEATCADGTSVLGRSSLPSPSTRGHEKTTFSEVVDRIEWKSRLSISETDIGESWRVGTM